MELFLELLNELFLELLNGAIFGIAEWSYFWNC